MMKTTLKSAALAALSSILFAACSLVPISERGPSSSLSAASIDAEEVAAADRKNAYLTSQIPESDRQPIALDQHLINGISEHCRATDYSTWLKPIKDPKELSLRDAFLARKLSRRFEFASLNHPRKRSTMIGRKDDVRELLCIGIAMNDGVISMNESRPANVGPGFAQRVLASPAINTPVFQILLTNWEQSPHDSVTPVQILNHPNVDPYTAESLLQGLLQNPFAPDVRLNVFRALLPSAIYRNNADLLSKKITNGLQNPKVSSRERMTLLNMLMNQRRSEFSHSWILQMALMSPDPSIDYTEFYHQLTEVESTQHQVEFLLSILRSTASYSMAEQDFTQLWDQDLESELKENMFSFAMSSAGKKRLSDPVIYRVMAEKITAKDATGKNVDTVLSFVRRSPETPLAARLALFQSTCDVPYSDPEVAFTLIETARSLSLGNLRIEDKITPCVTHNAKRFLGDARVFSSYAGYVRNMDNGSKKMLLLMDLMSSPTLDSGYLHTVAQEAVALRTEESNQVVRLILAHPNLNFDVLEQISRMYGSYAGRLKEFEKTVIAAMDTHHLANDSIRKQNQQNLNGGWGKLEEGQFNQLLSK